MIDCKLRVYQLRAFVASSRMCVRTSNKFVAPKYGCEVESQIDNSPVVSDSLTLVMSPVRMKSKAGDSNGRQTSENISTVKEPCDRKEAMVQVRFASHGDSRRNIRRRPTFWVFLPRARCFPASSTELCERRDVRREFPFETFCCMSSSCNCCTASRLH